MSADILSNSCIHSSIPRTMQASKHTHTHTHTHTPCSYYSCGALRADRKSSILIHSKPWTFPIIIPRRVLDTQDDHSSNPRTHVG